MMKNRHLSKAIAGQKLHEFVRQMKYKCEKNGATFIQADKWFPSSKLCSSCGHIKPNLKLSDRIYECGCGFVSDRDMNAAINLSKLAI
jgi:putative transposase